MRQYLQTLLSGIQFENGENIHAVNESFMLNFIGMFAGKLLQTNLTALCDPLMEFSLKFILIGCA